MLVVPLPLHLLDVLEIVDCVLSLGGGAQALEEVLDHHLVLALAGRGEPGQILENQLLPITGKPWRQQKRKKKGLNTYDLC